MFKAKTFALGFAAGNHPERVALLETLLPEKTIVYVDYGNVRGWQTRLGWQIDLAKMKDFFASFGVLETRFYFGTIAGDSKSEKFMTFVHKLGYKVRTKRLKKILCSINVTGSPSTSRKVIGGLVHQALLRHLPDSAISNLNAELSALNAKGIMALDFWKCNFDVEIASDMRLDHHLKKANSFCLISGDSDFADPLTELLNAHCPVSVISTSGHIASELHGLQSRGLKILDIKGLQDFIGKA